MKTHNISYRKVGDYNIPGLTLPPEDATIPLGKWEMFDTLAEQLREENQQEWYREWATFSNGQRKLCAVR